MNYKNITITIIITAGLILALYFFWHLPAVDDAYNRGLNACRAAVDTVLVQGDTITVYKEKASHISSIKPVDVITEGTDSATTTYYRSSFDSLIISNQDTIGLKAEVVLNNDAAKWIVDINHKDAELMRVDTLYITQNKLVTEIKKENNWLYNLIAFVAGVAAAVTVLLLGK